MHEIQVQTQLLLEQRLLTLLPPKSISARFRVNEINRIINLRLVKRHSHLIHEHQPAQRQITPDEIYLHAE